MRQTVTFIFINLIFLTLCSCDSKKIDYRDKDNWAFFDDTNVKQQADVFFVGPTVLFANREACNWQYFGDESSKKKYRNIVSMQKGIYDVNTRFYAPFYRQASVDILGMENKDREEYLTVAYHDIEDAFRYYMAHINKGQPIILAGFSQGAYLVARLVREHFNTHNLQRKFIACYAIGWGFDKDRYTKNPWYKFASSKRDLGVIVTFNCESPDVKSSCVVPEGTSVHCINPLNWRTDSAFADKSLNQGAIFVDIFGTCVNIVSNITGAYIDVERGVLKVPDIEKKRYPPILYMYDEGVYHMYDYQFFYRNLQRNVAERIREYHINDVKIKPSWYNPGKNEN